MALIRSSLYLPFSFFKKCIHLFGCAGSLLQCVEFLIFLVAQGKAFPTSDKNYKHFEGNSHAHLKSSTVGASQTLILNEGSLILGTWQNIYFCEFDGPRNRSYFVKIISG